MTDEKAFFMKKRRGNILDALSALIAIVACAILVTAFLSILRVITYKEEVRQLARSFLLKMETVGYLTDADRAELVRQLTQKQLTDIDLTGTTTADAGYGQDIVLSVKAAVPTGALDTSSGDLFSFVFAQTEWPIDICLQSTAKN